jgi:hypothetical protein
MTNLPSYKFKTTGSFVMIVRKPFRKDKPTISVTNVKILCCVNNVMI